MRRLLSIFLYTSLILAACAGNSRAQLKNGWRNPFDKDIWYKRYSGTIDGNPIIVNLALWDHYITGSYNFVDKSDQVEITFNKRDSSIDGALTLYGLSPNAEFKDTAGSKCVVFIQGDNIKGEWQSAGHKRTAQIMLKESYEESYPFDLRIQKDSIIVNDLSGLYSTYKMTVPGRKMKRAEAEWFEKALSQQLGGEGADANSLDNYIKITDRKEFASYKKLMDDTLVTPENFSLTMVVDPWYNNHGIVVLKVDYYAAIPKVGTRESYYCLDMDEKKVLHLSDIMTVDTTKLEALLEDDMKAWYAPMHPNYNGPFASVTNDIYVTDFGITFLFGNNDFLNTPCFFVPYSKLKDMLKPGFKARMKL
jgi:hypothetical protein